MAFKFITLLACVSVSFASAQLTGFNNLDFNFNNEKTESTTPVPILRFVDTQNDDGSYTYGYENGDGTYKIETRYVTGEVRGKYGYYDDTGVLREVEYGASKMGFEPSGSGLVGPDASIAHVAASAPVAPVAPRPVAPVAPVAPVTTNIRSNGRRVKVVRRRKPQQTQSVARESQRSAVFETLNDRTNDVRTMLPQARRQQFDNFSPVQQQQKPIINRRLPIRPTATTPRPAQPIQPAQPAQFASQSQQDALRQHEFDLQQVLRQQEQQQRQTGQQQQRQAQQQFRQQPNFFAPVSAPSQQAQAPSNLVGNAGFASDINLNTGSYTISYGR
jgi:hypothetical protein